MTTPSLVILGSGPAGYTAAVYAARALLNPLLITGHLPGGQLMTTTEVDNWPGEPAIVSGPALMDRMRQHAERLGVTIAQDTILSCGHERPFQLQGMLRTYAADALIIATGASANYLGLPSETAFKGRGVSACATCDGFFYKGLPVMVVGGGNVAAEEALFLASIASEVHLVHRRHQLRAEKTLAQQVVSKKNIIMHWDSCLTEVLGNDVSGVTHALLTHVPSNSQKNINVSGIFIAIGHTPNTHLFKDWLPTNAYGYLKVKGSQAGDKRMHTATNVPGVFAAGDVVDSVYRQAITSAGFGCMAALDAATFLEEC
jgi:thioredoxin reductase (NADPH)